jgi:GT2 family glycosyltransferase
MESPLVSIIIVNYNGKRFLKECLSSVFLSEYPNFEVIFVDNASTDRSVDFVSSIFSDKKLLKIIVNSENLGFGPANNVGFEQAKGKYVVFLNNDTSVEPDWLECLVVAMENDASIGLASSLFLNMNGRTIQTAGILKCDYMMPSYWIGMDRNYSEQSFPEVFEISSAMGASMILRREFLEQMGGFDPKYFYYYDDDYLSFRTWIAGKRVVTVSGSRLRHSLGGTSGSIDLFKYRHSFIGSSSLIFAIYLGKLELLKALLIFSIYKLLLESILSKKIVRFQGSMKGALWVLRNLKYIWRNRLVYWGKSQIDERTLRDRMIRIRIPSAFFLSNDLYRRYLHQEIERYNKSFFTASKRV